MLQQPFTILKDKFPSLQKKLLLIFQSIVLLLLKISLEIILLVQVLVLEKLEDMLFYLNGLLNF